jgi:hypothetical protein
MSNSFPRYGRLMCRKLRRSDRAAQAVRAPRHHTRPVHPANTAHPNKASSRLRISCVSCDAVPATP